MVDEPGYAQLKLALEATRIGVWERDLTTNRIVSRSSIVDELFGFAPGEAGDDATAFFARVHPEDHARIMQRVDEKLRGNTPPRQGEFRVLRPDGSVCWLAVRGEIMRDDDGTPRRIVSVIMDITRQKKVEEDLRDALERQLVLTKEVHHRVKNNLQVIASMIRLSKRDAPADFEPHIDRLSQRVWAIGQIYNLLTLGSGSATVDLGELSGRICKHTFEALGDRSGRIQQQHHIHSIPVPVDTAVPVALILTELLTNAFKHAFPQGRKGTIAVSLDREDHQAIMVVRDDGVGVSGTTLERPLGLGLVRALADQVDGRIDVDSSPGTAFRVTFPIPGPRMSSQKLAALTDS
jgi:PAS domain S-box-containing protein